MPKKHAAKEETHKSSTNVVSIAPRRKDQRDTNIEELRESLCTPDVSAPPIDHIEHEIGVIDVLLILLEGDVSTLAVTNRDPYVDEIRSRLTSMRAYVAMARLPPIFPFDAAIRRGDE